MTGNEHKFDRPCVVVMGGSFNPPTIAHLRLMLAAVEAVGLKKHFCPLQ